MSKSNLSKNRDYVEALPSTTDDDRQLARRYLVRKKAYDIITVLGLEQENQ